MVAFFVPPPGGAVIPFGLTLKGYGRVQFQGSGARTLNYSTVASGSAPVAGDLVVWICARLYNGGGGIPDPFDNLTGSGWAQQRVTLNGDQQIGSILGKVVVAGDISSPPTILDETLSGTGMFMWTAYSISGVVSSVSALGISMNYGDNGAPSSIPVNSSGIIGYAITVAEKSGDDGSLQLGGVTWDNQQSFDGSLIDFLAGSKLDGGGASYTVTGGDDGFFNSLLAGYIQVL